MYHIRPMTEQDAEKICNWRYDPPYDFYNWPSWSDMQRDRHEFGDSQLRTEQYAAVCNAETGKLVGFAQFFPLTGVTRLGLGMRPDLCGYGQGAAFAKAIAEEALRRRPTDEIDLEVDVWNERARRAYERAGFVVTDTYQIAVATRQYSGSNASTSKSDATAATMVDDGKVLKIDTLPSTKSYHCMVFHTETLNRSKK